MQVSNESRVSEAQQSLGSLSPRSAEAHEALLSYLGSEIISILAHGMKKTSNLL